MCFLCVFLSASSDRGRQCERESGIACWRLQHTYTQSDPHMERDLYLGRGKRRELVTAPFGLHFCYSGFFVELLKVYWKALLKIKASPELFWNSTCTASQFFLHIHTHRVLQTSFTYFVWFLTWYLGWSCAETWQTWSMILALLCAPHWQHETHLLYQLNNSTSKTTL